MTKRDDNGRHLVAMTNESNITESADYLEEK